MISQYFLRENYFLRKIPYIYYYHKHIRYNVLNNDNYMDNNNNYYKIFYVNR